MDKYFKIELIIIAIVFIFQISHSIKVYLNINILKSIFNHLIEVRNGFLERHFLNSPEMVLDNIIYYSQDEEEDLSDENTLKISVTETRGTNEIILRIKDAINSYLINNYGAAVNFSIIKDIIDREVDAKDEEISQSIPTPLYLGLAATMIGIIFGLFAMGEVMFAQDNIDDKIFFTAIRALINGVTIAMAASLVGLVCTTLLSSIFYKMAKKTTLKEKNQQLSYLQAKLLPELVRAEDTGVSGLKASLDRFAREATKISNNVKIAADQTGMNLQAQLDIISKVENLNMTKVSKVNLELFDRLEINMAAFNKFSNYLTLMKNISENLYNFSSQTENVQVIASEIKNTLKDSQELSRFLTAHFQKIESTGSAALNAVNLSDVHFREAIEKLSAETNTRISALNTLSDNAESNLSETFENIGSKLNEITEKHLSSLSIAYNESVPSFEQLDNLKLLSEINNNSTNQSKELIDAIGKLNNLLNNINTKIDNQSVLERLDLIEIGLKGIKLNGNKPTRDPKPQKKGFFRKIRDSFSKKHTTKIHEEE